MNKDEIKKGLTVCAGDSCDNCSYYKFHNCYDRLKLDARSLIIEQEKEIEQLTEERNRYAETLAKYQMARDKEIMAQKKQAVKEGYEKARKETAKKIFQKVVNICIKEEDFQDGTVNTQLEPLYFGIMHGCAFIRGEVKKLAEQYGVEVEE